MKTDYFPLLHFLSRGKIPNSACIFTNFEAQFKIISPNWQNLYSSFAIVKSEIEKYSWIRLMMRIWYIREPETILTLLVGLRIHWVYSLLRGKTTLKMISWVLHQPVSSGKAPVLKEYPSSGGGIIFLLLQKIWSAFFNPSSTLTWSDCTCWGSSKSVWKLFILDRNTWYHITAYKLFLLSIVIWSYLSCQLVLYNTPTAPLQRGTPYHYQHVLRVRH